MADALCELLQSCERPVVLCGHSYGGNVSLHAALKASKAVDALALFEPVFLHALRLTGRDDLYGEAMSFFAAYADKVLDGSPEEVSSMIAYWFGDGAFEKLPPSVQEFLVATAHKNALDVRASFAETLTAEDLSTFEKPVNVLFGGKSPPVAPAIAAALSTLLPQARLEKIDGATHGMLDETSLRGRARRVVHGQHENLIDKHVALAGCSKQR